MRRRSAWDGLRRLLRGDADVAREIDAELDFHVEGRVEELVAEGWDEAEARREVLRRFGDREGIEAECRGIAAGRERAERREEVIMGMVRNVRLALRSLARSPGFALVSIVTLALGIGANAAIFSFVDGVMLRPLPYAEPSELVTVWPGMVTNTRATEWLQQDTRSFTAIAGASTGDFPLTGEGGAEQVRGARVSPAWFDVLGARPLLGRTFVAEDQDPDRSRVVVLGHALWRERYGADPAVVGRTVRILSTPYTVIGVMPADFRPLDARTRLWVPQDVEPGTTVGTDESWWVSTRIARLAPGVAPDAAARDLRAAAARLAEEFPTDVDSRTAAGATIVTLRDALVGDFGRTLGILLGAVGLVLLVACANVANLLLARAGTRRREVAVRTALGAGRGQIVSQLLTESLVLGALGGVTGTVAAWATLGTLASLAPVRLPRVDEVHINPTVLLFAVGISLLSSLLFGLLPAWRATRVDPGPALGGSTRGTAGAAGSGRTMSVIIATEVCLSVVLAVASGLLVNSLLELRAVDPGFRSEGVLTFQVAVPPPEGDDGADPAFHLLWDRLAATPGVRSVGAIQALPLTEVNNRYPFWAEDNEPVAGARAPTANIRAATPGYLATLGIPLLEGRWFTDADRRDAPPVMSVNRALAERLWPGGDALGKRVRLLSGESFEWTVVGVVGDVRQTGLARDPAPEIYLPHDQWTFRTMFVVLRTDGDPASLAPAARRAVEAVDPDITVARVATMSDVVAESIASDRFLTALVGAFGLLALGLGAMGVYGVVAHAVARRTPEFGVRMALGSSRRRIVGRAMAEGLAPAGVGVLAGLLVAWAATRLLASVLYEVEPTDPLTWLSVIGGLAAVAALACWLPARRATRLDPSEALRAD